MDKHLEKTTFKGEHKINISGSKSESNRLLILQALFPEILINNLSTADDTVVLKKALHDNSEIIDVHHAGTAMRFLTAYFAFFTKKTVILTGSQRMQNRPIEILVEALKSLGAKIEYQEKIGYPPIKIYPSKIEKREVELQANISSQYISALMISAPKLPNGLKINFTSKPTSLPYIKMTEELLKMLGFKVKFKDSYIQVFPSKDTKRKEFDVESDWSSASYFYSLVALSPNLKLNLSTFKKESLQGDALLSELYKPLGVKTTYESNAIVLENTQTITKNIYKKDLNATPDLAQTIAVSCLGLNIECKLTGLHTLKIKETDRLVAMKNELEKFGAKVNIDDDSLIMHPSKKITPNQNIATYNDHRMAMAFAPLCSKTSLKINDAEVVSKSYQKFWQDLDNIKK
jgi:3-phosphoshikimate 1-carboxyvinyltransferase